MIIMNQLKSIYNSPFKDSHSHPIHTCFLIIACNGTVSVVMRESEESTPCLALACCLLLKVLSETVQSGLVAVSRDSEEHA